ncbi:hypothetical protein GQ457_11G033140 [Hibiscus cannabinus]
MSQQITPRNLNEKVVVSCHTPVCGVCAAETCPLSRVFERKLRPKPLGRGHVCLGVTHRCPHPTLTHGASVEVGAKNGLPCAHRSRLT